MKLWVWLRGWNKPLLFNKPFASAWTHNGSRPVVGPTPPQLAGPASVCPPSRPVNLFLVGFSLSLCKGFPSGASKCLSRLWTSGCWQDRQCPPAPTMAPVSDSVPAPRVWGYLPNQRHLPWLAVAVSLLFLSITVVERGILVAGAQPVSLRPRLARSCTARRHFVPAKCPARFAIWAGRAAGRESVGAVVGTSATRAMSSIASRDAR